jgi:hypothetical protein
VVPESRPGPPSLPRPQLLRHRDAPAAMLRSPLCQSGMSQGQSRSSVHGRPRRRVYALPIEPSRTVTARTRSRRRVYALPIEPSRTVTARTRSRHLSVAILSDHVCHDDDDHRSRLSVRAGPRPCLLTGDPRDDFQTRDQRRRGTGHLGDRRRRSVPGRELMFDPGR